MLSGGLVAAGLITSSAAAAGGSATNPVPSLTPAATQRLWTELVQRPRVHALRTAACQPLRAVFYAPTDWRRLATKLAATPSPCAQYYISVPPVGDKTQSRADEAWRIRALGPAFHALAEISVNGWTAWVASTGQSWYAAGVEARRRMAAAGYDVAAGDTWALNELSSAVRQGTGNARANMRAFLNGLYDGDGTLPAARGPVFIAGIGQATTDLSLYQARLQDWYEDAGFWNDLSRFASDWSQEVYGDVRHYAVAGATREARRDLLNEYLQHQTSLAGVAPASADAARSFLAAFSSPLANAAWRYDAAFGWTDVPVELMQDYVSAQTYALRSAGNGRFGYAWSPKNLAGIPDATFNAQTDAVLVRLAAAIADSGDTPEAGCGAAWCTGSLDGATATTAWRTFGAWQPSRLAFTSPEQTVAPGAASTPLTVELQTSTGTPYTAGVPVTVALSSSSSTGELATGPGGPWTATLTTPIASGVSSTSFYFRDAGVGSATITAAAAGKVAATQSVTVGTAAPSPPASPPSIGRRWWAGAGSRRPGDRDTCCAGRRRHDHVRAHRPEPRRPCVARTPRRPASVAGRLRRQPEGPRAGLHRCVRRSHAISTSSPATSSRPCGSAPSSASPGRWPSRPSPPRSRADSQPANDTARVVTVVEPPADDPCTRRRSAPRSAQPARRRAHVAGARRRDPVRPLLGRRRRPARGTRDDTALDAADHTARGHVARGSPVDEGAAGCSGQGLARRHVPLQGADRRGQAGSRPHVPRQADGGRRRRPAPDADDPRQGLIAPEPADSICCTTEQNGGAASRSHRGCPRSARRAGERARSALLPARPAKRCAERPHHRADGRDVEGLPAETAGETAAATRAAVPRPSRARAEVHSRFDPRLHFVGSVTPDRNGRGLKTSSVPPLDSGTYTLAYWCPGCAGSSRGRTFFVQRPEQFTQRYRSRTLLRIDTTQACPVTLPNANRPPGQPRSVAWYGNGLLWAGLSADGVNAVPYDSVGADGSIGDKLLWVTSPSWSVPTITGERLDAPAPPLRVLGVNQGSFASADEPSFMSPVSFPTAGCWRLRARVGDVSLSYVVDVVVRPAP